MTKVFALLIFFLAPFLFAETQAPQSNPCLDPQQKQFDFWVGEWNLTWPDAKPGQLAHGTNSIKRILDGCVVQESFSGGEAMHLRGTSVSTFDLRSNHWKQTWVDNEGGYLDFDGDFSNGQMILQREAVRNGEKILQRMVWKNISADELDWSWESSADGGKSWQVNWPIHYKRMR
ncbi:MAG TPA: DUF1579 family protein [Candidatus Sulfotelmatobacter sp.]|nr:DUF1579 family protein [Candidatus Sulfotelmatobacter sp.]